MNKEFIPYEQALVLKELGFDEPCWAWWHIEDCDTRFCYSDQRSPIINSRETEVVGLPLYQQAFRWLHEQLGFKSSCMPLDVEHRKTVLNNNIKSLKEKYGNTRN